MGSGKWDGEEMEIRRVYVSELINVVDNWGLMLLLIFGKVCRYILEMFYLRDEEDGVLIY